MNKVKNGLFVRVEYKGMLENGEVFDASPKENPIEFQMGKRVIIPGFEAALLGMAVNETKTVTLSPDQAYGHHDDSRMLEFPKSEIPPGQEPENGKTLMLNTPEGRQVPARVINIDDENVTFDLNHPLAGQTLTFKISVVGISDTATYQNCGCGAPGHDGQCTVHYGLEKDDECMKFYDKTGNVMLDLMHIKVNNNGEVADFLTNDKCAAGTGRFLQVMADVLEVPLEELGAISFTSDAPAKISSVCTIFAEPEVVSLRAEKVVLEDIVAGIHQSVVKRVAMMAARMGKHENVVFTGGVAKNIGVRRVLEKELASL